MFQKIFGAGILFGCLAIVYMFESSSHATGFMRIFHWPAMLLTGVGPQGLVLMSGEGKTIIKTFKLLFQSPAKVQLRQDRAMQALQKLSTDFYANGTKALESVDLKQFSPLFQRMIDRLAVRMPVGDIRTLVLNERGRAEMRLGYSVSLIGLGVRLSPSVGMLGTILGMTQLLSSMTDPSQIGGHMSLALLTTFFGLFFSLVIWTPLQQRLENLMIAELYGYDQVLHWLELLEKRKPAYYFEDLSEKGFEAKKAAGKKA